MQPHSGISLARPQPKNTVYSRNYIPLHDAQYSALTKWNLLDREPTPLHMHGNVAVLDEVQIVGRDLLPPGEVRFASSNEEAQAAIRMIEPHLAGSGLQFAVQLLDPTPRGYPVFLSNEAIAFFRRAQMVAKVGTSEHGRG